MLRAQEYEEAHGIVSPTATSTVASSAAAVGTIATADAELARPPPELAETPPLPEEEAYYSPAQEAAPMSVDVSVEDDRYASQSQVCRVLLTFPSYLNRGYLTTFFSILHRILLRRKACPKQLRRAKMRAMITCLRKRKSLT